MYPIVRTALTFARARRMSRIAPTDPHVTTLRCWPWDADMFWEMNNGRVLTLYDLGRFGMAQRTGLTRVLRQEGWGLVVAGCSIRYRARVRPFQTVELRTRVVGWDRRFFYIEQAMWRGDIPCNHGLMRTGVTEAGRLVETPRVAAALGVEATSPPLPDWVGDWADADATRPWPPDV